MADGSNGLNFDIAGSNSLAMGGIGPLTLQHQIVFGSKIIGDNNTTDQRQTNSPHAESWAGGTEAIATTQKDSPGASTSVAKMADDVAAGLGISSSTMSGLILPALLIGGVALFGGLVMIMAMSGNRRKK
ncbi:MAG: hypothetical protein LBK99_01580 [Opitutaceae bacterium]|jgi:hypothetical protein|nr:hypothetical protein [Opitutaceae bacterium]